MYFMILVLFSFKIYQVAAIDQSYHILSDYYSCKSNGIKDDFYISLRKWRPDKDAYWSYCAGTLINENFVLTAAHCFETETKDDIVAVENYKIIQEPLYHGEVTKLINVEIHPEYNRLTNQHDVAILQLAFPIKESNDVHFVKLPPQKIIGELSGIQCSPFKIMGWGSVILANINTKPFYPISTRCVDFNIITNDACKESFEKALETNKLLKKFTLSVFDSNVCVTAYFKDDIWTPEYGAPLICQDVQYGIASWAIGAKLYPSVFQRVDTELEFIHNVSSLLATTTDITPGNEIISQNKNTFKRNTCDCKLKDCKCDDEFISDNPETSPLTFSTEFPQDDQKEKDIESQTDICEPDQIGQEWLSNEDKTINDIAQKSPLNLSLGFPPNNLGLGSKGSQTDIGESGQIGQGYSSNVGVPNSCDCKLANCKCIYEIITDKEQTFPGNFGPGFPPGISGPGQIGQGWPPGFGSPGQGNLGQIGQGWQPGFSGPGQESLGLQSGIDAAGQIVQGRPPGFGSLGQGIQTAYGALGQVAQGMHPGISGQFPGFNGQGQVPILIPASTSLQPGNGSQGQQPESENQGQQTGFQSGIADQGQGGSGFQPGISGQVQGVQPGIGGQFSGSIGQAQVPIPASPSLQPGIGVQFPGFIGQGQVPMPANPSLQPGIGVQFPGIFGQGQVPMPASPSLQPGIGVQFPGFIGQGQVQMPIPASPSLQPGTGGQGQQPETENQGQQPGIYPGIGSQGQGGLGLQPGIGGQGQGMQPGIGVQFPGFIGQGQVPIPASPSLQPGISGQFPGSIGQGQVPMPIPASPSLQPGSQGQQPGIGYHGLQSEINGQGQREWPQGTNQGGQFGPPGMCQCQSDPKKNINIYIMVK